MQDCLATIPPYPYYIGDRGADYDGVASIPDPDSMWVVRPQLFFTCTVRPPHATRGRHNKYAEDIALNLVFFSAFEDLGLRTTGTMESNGIRKLYEPSPVPTLYVGRVEDINDWLWNFGRPQPRVGGLSVAKTERIRRSPGLRHPGVLGRPGRPARWQQKRYDMYILGICLAYTCQIFMLNKTAF